MTFAKFNKVNNEILKENMYLCHLKEGQNSDSFQYIWHN